MSLYVSQHAVDRHAERFGGANSAKSIEKRTNSIRRVVAFGVEVEPKERLKMLLRNNCTKASYHLYRNIVAVVENNRVVTVYRYNRDEFKDLIKEESK